MLKVSIDGDRCEQFHVSGNLLDLCANIGFIVGQIYADTGAHDPAMAAHFRAMVQATMHSDSPTWTLEPKTDGVSQVISFAKKEG